MSIYEKLTTIQEKIVVEKGKLNKFGNYKYRSVDDIFGAIKPLLKEEKVALVITTALRGEGNEAYIEAICKLKDLESDTEEFGTAYAKIDYTRKGMSYDQMTGSAITYAVKYALSNLLLLEAEEDADAKDNTTMHEGLKFVKADKREEAKKEEVKKEDTKLTAEQLKEIMDLKEKGILNETKALEFFKKEKFEDLTQLEAQNLINNIKKSLGKGK